MVRRRLTACRFTRIPDNKIHPRGLRARRRKHAGLRPPSGHPRAHRRPARRFARRNAGAERQPPRRPRRLPQHGPRPQLPRTRPAQRPPGRLPEPRPGALRRRARGADDAQSAAIPGGAVRGAARRAGGGQRQSAVHRARTAPSVGRLPGPRHRGAGKLRPGGGRSPRRHASAACDRHRRRRPAAGATALAGQRRGAPPIRAAAATSARRGAIPPRALGRRCPALARRQAGAGRAGHPAIHRRHHRPRQGRDAEPRQPAGQYRTGPAGAGRRAAGRPRRGGHAAAAVPRVRAGHQLPAGQPAGRPMPADRQSARPG